SPASTTSLEVNVACGNDAALNQLTLRASLSRSGEPEAKEVMSTDTSIAAVERSAGSRNIPVSKRLNWPLNALPVWVPAKLTVLASGFIVQLEAWASVAAPVTAAAKMRPRAQF